MLRLVARIFGMSRKEPTGQSTQVLHRLQRECVRQVLHHEGKTPGRTAPQQPVDPAPPVRQSTHETKLDTSRPTRLVVPAEATSANRRAPSLLQRVRSWLMGTASASQVDERRAGCRHSFGQSHPQVRLLVGSARWPAQVCDISTKGVAFIVGLRQQPRSSVQLTFRDTSRGIAWQVEARVVRVKLLGDGQWLLACDFDRPFDEAELAELL